MSMLRIIRHHAFWPRLQEGLAALRWPALALGAMACASLALWFAGQDLQRQHLLLQADMALTHKRTEALRATPSGAVNSAGSLEAFKSGFPDMTLREQRTLDVLALAGRWGLVVKQTSLRPLAHTGLGLAGYDVTLPITGTYVGLRGFVDEALRVDPGLALRSIKIQRKDIQADTLQAQLVFTLWMRQGAAQ